MEYGDFYDLAEYANESWNGSYTEKEVAENAYDYYSDFLWSKRNETVVDTIRELLEMLNEDNSEDCVYWANEIRRELAITK
jgi:hypothetical protein